MGKVSEWLRNQLVTINKEVTKITKRKNKNFLSAMIKACVARNTILLHGLCALNKWCWLVVTILDSAHSVQQNIYGASESPKAKTVWSSSNRRKQQSIPQSTEHWMHVSPLLYIESEFIVGCESNRSHLNLINRGQQVHLN
jgi:hypothetical protein